MRHHARSCVESMDGAAQGGRTIQEDSHPTHTPTKYAHKGAGVVAGLQRPFLVYHAPFTALRFL